MNAFNQNGPGETRAPASAEFEALNVLVEVYFRAIGQKEAMRHLRLLAAELVEAQPLKVVGIREGIRETREQREARAWLQDRLSIWLARHG